MDIRVGWSYSSWVEPFYPGDAQPRDFPRLYGRIFDVVEIDSSFYRVPDRRVVES